MIPAKKSRLFAAWFARHVEKRVRAQFVAVRVRGLEQLKRAAESKPVLIVSNHTSWWDPMFSILLGYSWLRGDGYALMDAKNLRRFPFLGRVGGFGVTIGDPADGRKAIKYAVRLLGRPGRIVWFFPQARERPFTQEIKDFKPGAAMVARLSPAAAVFPVGLRYVFGAAEKPEAFVSIGDPLPALEDLEAGRLAQQQAVSAELRRIDNHLHSDGEISDFEFIIQTKASCFARFAQRLLSYLTRYRFGPGETSRSLPS